MAFRAPTQAPQRPVISAPPPAPIQTEQTPRYQSPLEDSQEWVLFSPSQAPSATRTQTASTERTPRTAGLSRVSEFGSLETAARSQDDDNSEAIEDEDLDSLDDGLHAFREPSVYRTPSNLYRTSSNRLDQSGGTVLPTHDGLGTFPASNPQVQDQLYQFEQYNPKRKYEGHHTRRSSVQRRLDAVQERDLYSVEDERRLRIEQWRVEQSRALLDEIEKETRRRRSSRVGSLKMSPVDTLSIVVEDNYEEEFNASPPQTDADESFLQRITRRVIKDLIGIDELTLSAIFGETLIPEEPPPPIVSSTNLPSTNSPFSTTPTSASHLVASATSWQDRLLDRIARELGVLVHQLTEHPGAFSTYIRSMSSSNQSPSTSPTDTYAGIPITRSSTPRPISAHKDFADTNPSTNDLTSPIFSPTLNHHHHRHRHSSSSSHAALWGIEDSQSQPKSPFRHHSPSLEPIVDDSAYWEHDIDLKTLFRFLRDRFRHRRSMPPTPPESQQPTPSTSPQDPARRAAIIREHHPLVARAHAPNASPHRRQSSSGRHRGVLLRRRPSSCASQSTKVSTKRGSISGSSRNYWDLGESVGSERGITAGVGTWGEI